MTNAKPRSEAKKEYASSTLRDLSFSLISKSRLIVVRDMIRDISPHIMKFLKVWMHIWSSPQQYSDQDMLLMRPAFLVAKGCGLLETVMNMRPHIKLPFSVQDRLVRCTSKLRHNLSVARFAGTYPFECDSWSHSYLINHQGVTEAIETPFEDFFGLLFPTPSPLLL